MSSNAPRTVRSLSPGAFDPAGHEHATHRRLVERVAELLGLPQGAELLVQHIDPAASAAPTYFVPLQTISTALASACGIHGTDDLFGGVVPHLHVGTKLITHGLVSPGSIAPEGWSMPFARAVEHVVLRGYSVFDADDLRRAAAMLLADGAVRFKQPGGIGGEGQQVVASPEQLATACTAADDAGLWRDGLVVEQNLGGVTTFSVGQVELAGTRMSYVGRQELTPNHQGSPVYGGSELWCVRGDFDALDAFEPDARLALAIRQARTYHEAALRNFPGIVLSRANYDVAQGTDAKGNWCSGVLEQSWRVGGASAAEIEAVAVLVQQPRRQRVRTRTVERYGDAVAPAGALVLFQGDDPRHGRMLKYAQVIPDATA